MAQKNQWTLTGLPPLQMGGIALFEDEFGYIPDGDFRCLLIDSQDWGGENGQPSTSILFNARVEEDGETKGMTIGVWCGKEYTKEGVARQWKALYRSLGYTEASLAQPITPEVKHFIANPPLTCYVRVRNKTPYIAGQKRKAEDANRQFITKEAYEEAKKRPTPVPHFTAQGAQPGLPGPAAPPTQFGPPGSAAAPAAAGAVAPSPALTLAPTNGSPPAVAQPTAAGAADLFGPRPS